MALVAHNAALLGPNLGMVRRWGALSAVDVITIDATSEKAMFFGYVAWPGAATKSIRKILVRTRTVSVNSGSQIRFSLQNLSNTSGTPAQPDGSVDQSVTLAGSAFSSNANILTGALDSDRSVAWGDDPIAVVIEYTTFNTGDSIQLQTMQRSNSNGEWGWLPGVGFYNGTSWPGDLGQLPVLAFEASDGTIGNFFGTVMITGAADLSWTTAENANKFQVAEPCTFCGFRGFLGSGFDTRDITATLYDAANTVLSSVTIRGAWMQYGGGHWNDIAMPLYDLEAATDYWLAIKPAGADSTGAKQVRYIDVPTSSHVGLWGMGSGACYSTRATPGSGSWTEDTDRILGLHPYVLKFHDGTGGGGGGGRRPRLVTVC